MIKVIALDLEGTLISNAMSQIPRSGLCAFLDVCHSITERTVIYTTVKEVVFRQIARTLVSEQAVPEWFADMEYIHWEGQVKDLKFIPNSQLDTTVLVDDFEGYVHPSQTKNWLAIRQFAYPYPDIDKELSLIAAILLSKHIDKSCVLD